MYRVPKYRLHKARNVAVVTIDGKDHYLGEYNSTASRQRYHRLLLDKLSAANTRLLPAPLPGTRPLSQSTELSPSMN